jgi:hypothetical protein
VDGETRTRTGDTTIFSQMLRALEQCQSPASNGSSVAERKVAKSAMVLDEGSSNRVIHAAPEVVEVAAREKLKRVWERDEELAGSLGVEITKRLKRAGLTTPDIDDIERWLQAPVIKGGGGGIQILGSGANADRSAAINEGDGFRDEGFQATIDDWLRECFPSRELGGFICLIDNLELLETSQAARSQLGYMASSLTRSSWGRSQRWEVRT